MQHYLCSPSLSLNVSRCNLISLPLRGSVLQFSPIDLFGTIWLGPGGHPTMCQWYVLTITIDINLKADCFLSFVVGPKMTIMTRKPRPVYYTGWRLAFYFDIRWFGMITLYFKHLCWKFNFRKIKLNQRKQKLSGTKHKSIETKKTKKYLKCKSIGKPEYVPSVFSREKKIF